MRTFQEFIDWVRTTQPELDEAWNKAGKIKGVYEGCEGQFQIYGQLADELLGRATFQDIFHPRGDNFQVFVDRDLEQTLGLLKELGYEITAQEQSTESSSEWKRGSIRTPYYRLEHRQGVSFIQLEVDPVELLFYFDLKVDKQGNTAVGRFTSREEANFHKVPKRRQPDLTFAVQTDIFLNPYGHSGLERNCREKERIMEDRVVELMEAVITRKIPALYQARSWYCVVNHMDEISIPK